MPTKTICIDSIFCNNATDFIYTLDEPLTKVVTTRITSVEIPNLWYAFSSKARNNFFTIKFFNMTDLSDCECVVTIPDGNYVSAELTHCIGNYFSNHILLSRLVFCVNEFSSKCVFYVNQDTDIAPAPFLPLQSTYSPHFYYIIDFSVPNLPLQQTAGWMLGFRQHTYTIGIANIYRDTIYALNGNAGTVGSYAIDPGYINSILQYGYLESESSFGSSAYNYLYIELDDYTHYHYANFTTNLHSNGECLGKKLLAKIPINGAHNTIITNNAGDMIFKMREYLGPVKIDKMRFRVLTPFGDVLDLNQNSFSLTVECEHL